MPRLNLKNLDNHLMTHSHILRLIALMLTAGAFFSALACWLIDRSQLEALATWLGLLAAILAFFVDPWYESRSQRRDILQCLNEELWDNAGLMTALERGKEYTISENTYINHRLLYSCIDRFRNCGLFSGPYDYELRRAVISARTAIEYYNTVIASLESTMTELAFHGQQEAVREIYRKICKSKLLEDVNERFSVVIGILVNNYHAEIPIEVTPELREVLGGLLKFKNAGTENFTPNKLRIGDPPST